MPALLRPPALLAAAVAAHAAGFGALAALRHLAFSAGRFDLGNMVQAVWSTAHGELLAVTSAEGEQIVRLGAHVDPILILLAPLWWLWPRPELLLTVQATAVALGAVPVYLLALRRLRSERAALGFALAYLLMPALQWMTLADFHPVALATPLLAAAFASLDRDRLVPFAAFALLAIATKEHVGLVVAGLGLWYALARRRPLAGGAIATAGAAATVAALALVVPAFSPHGRSSFYGRYEEVGGSPAGLARTLLADPVRVAAEALEARDVAYVVELLAPLAALPLLAPLAAVAAAPEIAVNVLASTWTQTSIRFHYSAAALAVLACAAVLGAGRVAAGRVAVAERAALLAVVTALATSAVLGPLPPWGVLPGGEGLGLDAIRVSEHDRVAARAVELVPPEAVVSASNSLGAHLSARRRILTFPLVADARWVAVDVVQPGYADRRARSRARPVLARLRADPRWRLVFARDGVFVLRRVA